MLKLGDIVQYYMTHPEKYYGYIVEIDGTSSDARIISGKRLYRVHWFNDVNRASYRWYPATEIIKVSK